MTCRWCGQNVSLVKDLWVTPAGQRCTPQSRGAVCRLAYYAPVLGIDPLKLLDHDFACSCQRTIEHLPAPTVHEGGTDSGL